MCPMQNGADVDNFNRFLILFFFLLKPLCLAFSDSLSNESYWMKCFYSFHFSTFAFMTVKRIILKPNETEEVKIVLFVANWFLSVPNANRLPGQPYFRLHWWEIVEKKKKKTKTKKKKQNSRNFNWFLEIYFAHSAFEQRRSV